MRQVLVIALIWVALVNTSTLLLLWWVAAFNDWQLLVTFNTLNEHWVEGVLGHLCLAIVGVALWQAKKLLR